MYSSIIQPSAVAARNAFAQLYRTIRSQIFGYGLHGLDLRLLKRIDPESRRDKGYFVELGANNGLTQSNTFLLQQRFGWTGLLVEPSQAQYFDCIRNRSFGNQPSFICAACVDVSYSQEFVALEYNGLMTVGHGMELTSGEAKLHAEVGSQFLASSYERHFFGALARTLTSLLDEVSAPRQFDLLSLDVEGNELSVLKGLDFRRYRPRWILVEVRSDDVVNYIVGQGYHLVEELSDNGVYRDLLFGSP